MTLTPEQLAEWRKACEKATPGPWHTYMAEVHRAHVNDAYGVIPECHGVDERRNRIAGLHNTTGEVNQEIRNASFIAVARTALPALLDEVESLRAKLADYEARGWAPAKTYRERAEAAEAKLATAEEAWARAERAEERCKKLMAANGFEERPQGCLCTWEFGDSPCPVHSDLGDDST